MLRISVSACRKVGTADYGSIGATVAIEGIEVAEGTPAGQMDQQLRYWQDYCRQAVEAELARQAGGAPATANGHAPAAPSPTSAPAKERDVYGTAAGPGRSGVPAKARKVPQSGAALYAWAKGEDEDHGYGIVKHLSAWGKQRGADGRMSSWDDDMIAAGYREALAYIRGTVDAADLVGAGN